MELRIYITEKRLEHPTFSVNVITKHYNSGICDSEAKIFIPLQISISFFLF